jgi:hypothetical protein
MMPKKGKNRFRAAAILMGNLFQPKLFWQWKWKLINIERPYIIFPIIGLRCCIYNRPHSFRQNGNGGLNGVAQQC